MNNHEFQLENGLWVLVTYTEVKNGYLCYAYMCDGYNYDFGRLEYEEDPYTTFIIPFDDFENDNTCDDLSDFIEFNFCKYTEID